MENLKTLGPLLEIVRKAVKKIDSQNAIFAIFAVCMTFVIVAGMIILSFMKSTAGVLLQSGIGLGALIFCFYLLRKLGKSRPNDFIGPSDQQNDEFRAELRQICQQQFAIQLDKLNRKNKKRRELRSLDVFIFEGDKDGISEIRKLETILEMRIAKHTDLIKGEVNLNFDSEENSVNYCHNGGFHFVRTEKFLQTVLTSVSEQSLRTISLASNLLEEKPGVSFSLN